MPMLLQCCDPERRFTAVAAVLMRRFLGLSDGAGLAVSGEVARSNQAWKTRLGISVRDPGYLEETLGFFHTGLNASELPFNGKKVFAKEIHFVLRRLAVLTRVNVVNLRYLV